MFGTVEKMKIVENRNQVLKKFKDLKSGDVFVFVEKGYWKRDFLLKLDTLEGENYASLANGSIFSGGRPEDDVELIMGAFVEGAELKGGEDE